MNIDAAAARLIKILAKIAEASNQALATGAQGDELATRAAVDAIRGLQAKLQKIDQQTRLQLDQLPAATQARLQKHVDATREAQHFVSAWSKRYFGLLDRKTLMQTSDGRQAIIDYALADAWDFGSDIVVLIGQAQLVFVEDLQARGQRRIIVTGLAEYPESEHGGDVCFAKTPEAMRDYFAHIDTTPPERVTLLQSDLKDEEEASWAEVRHAFSLFKSNEYTSRLFGSDWLTQGLKNLPAIAESVNVSVLANALKGLPLVIISPGPSLDKNIHLLRDLKGRAVLMAAAQSARALSRAGVVPDFLVVADPGNLVYFLDGVDTSQIDGLIVGVSCNPGFYAKPFKNIITFNANATLDRWISNIFNDTLALSSAGSVTIDSMYIGQYLQCGPIIMVGLDLALADGKQYSSTSANSESLAVIDEDGKTLSFTNVSPDHEKVFLAKGASSEDTVEEVLTLPGYYGGTVFTRPNYHLFHGEFVQLAAIESKKTNPTPLFNCTEGGAYIEGFSHIPFAEAIQQHIGPAQMKISERIARACREADRSTRKEVLANALREMRGHLEEAIDLAAKCEKLCKQRSLGSKSLERLNQLEKQLIKVTREVPFIALPNQDQIQKALTLSADASTINESNGAALVVYKVICETGQAVLKIMNEGLDQLNCRGNSNWLQVQASKYLRFTSNI